MHPAEHIADFLPSGHDIDVSGVLTRYYDAGSGPQTVVLVYGGNFGSSDSASSAFVWSKNIAALARNFRVVAFDKLGQGFTEVPLRDEDYTMSAVVDHAIGLLKKLKLGPVHLVGHSRGGFLATRIALLHPEMVKSLTIVSSGTLSPGVGLNEVVLARSPFPSGSRDAARWIYQNYCATPDAVSEDWVDQIISVLRHPGYQAGVKRFSGESLGVRYFAPELAKIKRETLTWLTEGRLQRPTQLIWGANDRTVPVERGLQLWSLISAHERRTTFNLLNHAGHFTFREQPAMFNEFISSFVELHGA